MNARSRTEGNAATDRTSRSQPSAQPRTLAIAGALITGVVGVSMAVYSVIGGEETGGAALLAASALAFRTACSQSGPQFHRFFPYRSAGPSGWRGSRLGERARASAFPMTAPPGCPISMRNL